MTDKQRSTQIPGVAGSHSTRVVDGELVVVQHERRHPVDVGQSAPAPKKRAARKRKASTPTPTDPDVETPETGGDTSGETGNNTDEDEAGGELDLEL